MATAAPRALAPITGQSGVDGIPASYDDGRQWLRHGIRRFTRGWLVALFTASAGVWLALWGAAIGAVFGLLLGLGALNGHSLLGITAANSVGPFTILGGLVVGAVGGFLLVLRFIIFNNPLQWIASVVGAAIAAFLIMLVIAAYERLALRLRGYRRLTREEVRRVAPLVKQIADAHELDGLPRFAMWDSVIPGAWSHMRTVVLATGLLTTLDDSEIRAILTHELHHWRTGDAVGLRMVWACAWPIAITVNVGAWISRRRSALLQLVGWAIAWPALVSIKYVIVPVVAATQRAYEYEADAATHTLGDAQALISALRKLSAFETGRTGWEQAMAATHPPTALRIEALEAPSPDDPIYQEDELRGPSRAEVLRLLTPFWRRRVSPQPAADSPAAEG